LLTYGDKNCLTQVQSASVFKASLCSRGKDGTCEVLYNAYGNKPPVCATREPTRVRV
jgi:hypothetical protein